MIDEKDTKEKVQKKVEIKDSPKETTPKKTTEKIKVSTDSKTPTTDNKSATPDSNAQSNNKFGNNRRTFTKNRRTSRRSRPRSEFDQKILDIRRVTRVSAGGRRFSFSVAIAIGNKKGKVGIGTGKGTDIALAIQKAVKNAELNTIQIKTTKTMSIPHEVDAKFNSARVIIMPSPHRGIIAGSALRNIIELGGLNDINGKILSGSKNKLNIARATLKAFVSLDETVKFSEKPVEITKKEYSHKKPTNRTRVNSRSSK